MSTEEQTAPNALARTFSPQNVIPPPLSFASNPSVDKEHFWLGGPSGSSYRSDAQNRRIKDHCTRRDGQICTGCKAEEQFLQELHVHHIDGNNKNNFSDNLQLMHESCHHDVTFGVPIRRLAPNASPRVCSPAPQNATAQLGTLRKEILADSTSTSSTRLNVLHEVPFRRACFEAVHNMYDPAILGDEKFLNRLALKSYACEKSGASGDSATDYMNRLFAPIIGPLVMNEEENCVGFRFTKDQNLSVEELEARHPKEGQNMRREG